MLLSSRLSSAETPLPSAVGPLTSDSISLSFSFLPGKGVNRHGHYGMK